MLPNSSAGCVPFCSSLLADYFPPRFRGTAMGFFYWGVFMGFSLSFVLISVKEMLGWRIVYLVMGLPGRRLQGWTFQNDWNSTCAMLNCWYQFHDNYPNSDVIGNTKNNLKKKQNLFLIGYHSLPLNVPNTYFRCIIKYSYRIFVYSWRSSKDSF